MQAINVAVLNRWFLGALFGTAAACLLVAVASLTTWSEPAAWLRLGGSVLYLAGTILVTIAFNVPLNEGLAAVQPDSAEGVSLWPHYVAGWSAWNHVRAAAALSAAGVLTLARFKA